MKKDLDEIPFLLIFRILFSELCLMCVMYLVELMYLFTSQ